VKVCSWPNRVSLAYLLNLCCEKVVLEMDCYAGASGMPFPKYRDKINIFVDFFSSAPQFLNWYPFDFSSHMYKTTS
jgi:hypothetical protein